MKHRLSPLLNGMELNKSEHDWLEQRFENMTAKEELLFQGAMQIEHPRTAQETIQILQGLEHYRLLYGADDDVSLGRFVMEHIHTPTPAARGYLDPEIVGAAYREIGSGSFVGHHYNLWRFCAWQPDCRSVVQEPRHPHCTVWLCEPEQE